MSKAKRILIICHLCLALTYLFWLFIQPQVSKRVTTQHASLLYDAILTHPQYTTLSKEKQEELTKVQEQLTPINPRLLPKLYLLWLFLSLLLPILLLFQIEGAASATLLLPLLIAAQFFFYEEKQPDSSLFPSEEYVLAHYPREGKNRREKLLASWHSYLAQEWADQSLPYSERVEQGLFYFNVERMLELCKKGKVESLFTGSSDKLLCLVYLGWNLLFAIGVNYRKKWLSLEVRSVRN